MTVKKRPKPTAKQMANLIPMSKRSKKAQREIQSKGGKAAAVKMLEDKAFEKAVKIALAQTNPKTGRPYLDDLIDSIMRRGIEEGDTKVLAELRKTAGQDPAQKTEDVTDVSDILARARRRSKVTEDEDSSN